MRKSAAVLSGIVIVVGAGCHSTMAPTLTSTSTSTTSTISAPAISGVVMEGTRPLAGVRGDGGAFGPGSWVVTDANGAFQLPASLAPEGWFRTSKPGYVQPCAERLAGNGPFTLQMASLSTLTGIPLPSPSGFRTVSGIVRQMTSDGLQPAAGVWVDFEPDPSNDWPAAVTLTDAIGRFSLCGLPQDAVVIYTVAGSNVASTTVPSDQTSVTIDVHP